MRHARIIVTHYGGPDTLQVIKEECPVPQPGEVRVKVLAAGVSLPYVLAGEGIARRSVPLIRMAPIQGKVLILA